MFTVKCIFLAIFLILFTNAKITRTRLDLNPGDICKGGGSSAWKCQHLKDCPQIGDFRRNNPTICSFQGIDPIICCPPALSSRMGFTDTASSSIAVQKCAENINNCNRHQSDSNQHLLLPSKPRNHPEIVLIGYGEADSKSWQCGGTLISERWVLGAAHCAVHRSLGRAKWARVGVDASNTSEGAKLQEKTIKRIIAHPSFKMSVAYNDIALYELDSDVILNKWVLPICLQVEEEVTVSTATVVGWSRTYDEADTPQLLEAEMTLFNGTECRRLFDNSLVRPIPQGFNPDLMVCAGKTGGNKDDCSSYSGGPLVLQKGHCQKTQHGIVSFGVACGLFNTPGVYTKVSNYVPWIESIVWPNNL